MLSLAQALELGLVADKCMRLYCHEHMQRDELQCTLHQDAINTGAFHVSAKLQMLQRAVSTLSLIHISEPTRPY